MKKILFCLFLFSGQLVFSSGIVLYVQLDRFISDDNIDGATELLDDKGNVKKLRKKAFLLLNRLVENDNVRMVKLFLKQKMHAKLKVESATSLLCSAIRKGRVQIVKDFLRMSRFKAAVSLPDHVNNTPLYYAAQVGYGEIVEMLLERGAADGINVVGEGGQTPLVIAVAANDPAMVRVFLENGAQSSVVDDNGNTALYYAARVGSVEIVKMLLARGAADGINVAGEDGQTPLDFAVRANDPAMVRLLLQNGAKQTEGISGRGRNSPISIAEAEGYHEVAKLLALPEGYWEMPQLFKKIFGEKKPLSEREQSLVIDGVEAEETGVDFLNRLLVRIVDCGIQQEFIIRLFKITLREYTKKGGRLDDIEYDVGVSLLTFLYQVHYLQEKYLCLLAFYLKTQEPLKIFRPLWFSDEEIEAMDDEDDSYDGDDDNIVLFFRNTVSLKNEVQLFVAYDLQERVDYSRSSVEDIILDLKQGAEGIEEYYFSQSIEDGRAIALQLGRVEKSEFFVLLFRAWIMNNFSLDDRQLVLREDTHGEILAEIQLILEVVDEKVEDNGFYSPWPQIYDQIEFINHWIRELRHFLDTDEKD